MIQVVTDWSPLGLIVYQIDMQKTKNCLLDTEWPCQFVQTIDCYIKYKELNDYQDTGI